MKIEVTEEEALFEDISTNTRYFKTNSIQINEGVLADVYLVVCAQFIGIEKEYVRFATHGVTYNIEQIPEAIDLYALLDQYSHLELKSMSIKVANNVSAKVVLDYDLLINDSNTILNRLPVADSL